jgi:hypothetical protein
MEEQPMEKGVSRRSMLKRLGAGAAVAWSAPVLTTLGTPAFAQTPLCDSPCTDCQFGASCGGCGACVGVPSPDCFCADTGICLGDEPICQSDADCDAWCGEPGGRCAPCEFTAECFADGPSCWCPCASDLRRVRGGKGVFVVRATR